MRDWRESAHRSKYHYVSFFYIVNRASRLNVSSDCSLLITNITDEDAGRYLLRLGNKNKFVAYLHTLSSEYSGLNNNGTS
uniref:Immunoglobulin V-set domain-containing protein n=1 Tax=Oryzias latipes TaxID=8090 RepID=A0A3P9M4D3_ORYLA